MLLNQVPSTPAKRLCSELAFFFYVAVKIFEKEQKVLIVLKVDFC